MQRIHEGYCLVANPFNPKQISRVNLTSQEYPLVVFWTRNPKPLFRHLSILSDLGFQYYFLFTLVCYPKSIEPACLPFSERIRIFQTLAEQIGPEKVIWRYDPILISDQTPYSYHLEQFHRIAEALRGYTLKGIISFMTAYRKTWIRLKHLSLAPFHFQKKKLLPQDTHKLLQFTHQLLQVSQWNGISLQTCAEELQQIISLPIVSGACIDAKYIKATFSLNVINQKDPGQRSACQCISALDIGAYDTCLYGCNYCYAVTSFNKARKRYKEFQKDRPILLHGIDNKLIKN